VYYSVGAESGQPGSIWEIPALGGTPRRVASATSGADLSPDGRLVAFFRFGGGGLELTLAERDGSKARADGSWLYYSEGSGFASLKKVPPRAARR